MSKSWNKEELQAASKAMKEMGYMSFEEFCERLKTLPIAITETEISADVIKEYKQRQLAGEKMPCPRCGKDQMRIPATHVSKKRVHGKLSKSPNSLAVETLGSASPFSIALIICRVTPISSAIFCCVKFDFFRNSINQSRIFSPPNAIHNCYFYSL